MDPGAPPFNVSSGSQARLVEFVTGLRWDDLPQATRDMAKQCLLDDLGAAIVGTRAPVAAIAAEYAAAAWPAGGATVLATGAVLAPTGAAFANGAAANGTDIDDCGIYTWGHPGAQVFAAALALAEDLKLSGREMLVAAVVGYELAMRAGRCEHDFHDVYRACGSWGAVACAGLAGRLLAIPAETIPQALGIADYDSPHLPMMRDIDHPTMAKHGIGWGAMTGIMAAQLAAAGFTGPPSLLERAEYERWVADLGKDYLLDHGVTWKEFSCCAWAHPALAAVRELRSKHDIPLERVERITVETYDEACRLAVRLPRTTEEAQFSVAWPLAAMLVDGQVGPTHVLEERLGDPLLRRLATAVDLVPSEEFTRLHALIEMHDPEGADLAVVTLELDDNTTLSSGRVDYPLPRFTGEMIEDKFRALTVEMLGADVVDQLVATVWSLDEVDDVGALTRFARGGLIKQD